MASTSIAQLQKLWKLLINIFIFLLLVICSKIHAHWFFVYIKKSHSLGMFLMFFPARYALEGEFDYVNMGNVENFFGTSMVWQLSLHLIKCSRCLWFFQFSLQVLFGASFLFSFLQKLYVFFNFFHNWLLHFFLLLWHEFDDFLKFLSKCCFKIVLLSFIVVETFCYF